MSRLLVLCRRPHRLRRKEAEAWLGEQLEVVLHRDGLGGARLIGLEDAGQNAPREWDWLIELDVDAGTASAALGRGGACGELVADMRLLGMSPTVALAGERKTIGLRPA